MLLPGLAAHPLMACPAGTSERHSWAVVAAGRLATRAAAGVGVTGASRRRFAGGRVARPDAGPSGHRGDGRGLARAGGRLPTLRRSGPAGGAPTTPDSGRPAGDRGVGGARRGAARGGPAVRGGEPRAWRRPASVLGPRFPRGPTGRCLLQGQPFRWVWVLEWARVPLGAAVAVRLWTGGPGHKSARRGGRRRGARGRGAVRRVGRRAGGRRVCGDSGGPGGRRSARADPAAAGGWVLGAAAARAVGRRERPGEGGRRGRRVAGGGGGPARRRRSGRPPGKLGPAGLACGRAGGPRGLMFAATLGDSAGVRLDPARRWPTASSSRPTSTPARPGRGRRSSTGRRPTGTRSGSASAGPGYFAQVPVERPGVRPRDRRRGPAAGRAGVAVRGRRRAARHRRRAPRR